MSELKKEIASIQKNPATAGTLGRCCDVRCKICNSEHLKALHNLKKSGRTLDEIVEISYKDLKFEISKSSLSRHFNNYRQQQNLVSAQIINNDMIEEATKQAAHTKKTVILIDGAFKHLMGKLERGELRFDIQDLERLMKLRYQIMSGQDTDEKDILAIFQKATDKYGLNMQQGVLFKQ
ncbi:hypothetical protein KAR28_06175 [Candidatus Parcubacteria bacterium]|nr:hypothetical protein [Candidatus Parcubacteria bacterium]